MILRVLKYSFVQAKTKALKAGSLSAQDWHYLLSAKNLKEIFRYLLGTPYGPYLGHLGPETGFQKITLQLYASLFRDYKRLLKFVPSQGKGLLKALRRRYEAENLKLIIRGLFRHQKKEIRELLYPLEEIDGLDLKSLLEAPGVIELVERLKESLFYAPLKEVLPLFQGQGRVFPLERTVDLATYEALVISLKGLKKGDRHQAQRLVNHLIDQQNLNTICRLKQVFRLSPEEIIGYLITGAGRLNLKKLGGLARAQKLKEFLSLLPRGYNDLKAARSFSEIFLLMEQIIARELIRIGRKDPFQIGTQGAYLLFKELEIKNLERLLTAVGWGLTLKKGALPLVAELERISES